jgi:peroxiredoxin
VIRLSTVFVCCVTLASSQNQPSPESKKVVYTKEESGLVSQVRILRQLPEEKRGMVTKDTALAIRRLPPSLNKLRLADALAFVSTEGDAGHETLQEVAATLAGALREQPGKLETAYVNLAQLVDYEQVSVSLDDPLFTAALSKLKADDQHRRELNFTLADLNGKKWTLKDLRGKVTLVNFWASLSPPCQKEMLDLKSIYQNFEKQDLIILAISGEKQEQLAKFVKEQNIPFPVLLDPDHKVAQLYRISGVPKTFVYDRDGKLVAQAIDLRTHKQLLSMLRQAGLP